MRPVAGLRVQVRGVVQGVGFRPFVHRLAARHGLAGWVRNESGQVEIALCGPDDSLQDFLGALRSEAPPLARIDQVTTRREPVLDARAGFRILESGPSTDHRQPVPPDVATCAACLAELADPADRRFRYPFTTCTDCGPRYSVIEDLPYDRERTSMRAFAQCAACRQEYDTPGDRRHHSETNSCPACGPTLTLRFSDATPPTAPDADPLRTAAIDADPPAAALDADPLRTAAAFLRAGWIVALRGIGGFHLAADATSDAAVELLRERKRRDAKPLAVMVSSVAEARQIACVGPAEARLLESGARPVVLMAAREDSAISKSVAPGLSWIGVMLAYTPLHLLLLEQVGRPLVMTSGNISEEPIAARSDEAMRRLGSVADVFLTHDREIVASIDDSVVRAAGSTTSIIRRGRGMAPLPIPMPIEATHPIAAVGGHLKNTFTIAQGRRAYVSPHVGDLESLETLQHFRAVLASYERLFRVRPEVAVHDLHPGYLSTRIAGELGLRRTIAVQHHHAHVVAVAGENAVTAPVLGVAFDGTGYGDDGKIWGAELMVAEPHGYRRLAQLRYSPLPGGELAVRSPWRSALGFLSLEPELAREFALAFAGVDGREREIAELQIARSLNSPLASSMGRLFDAAAAVIGVRRLARYEGQAAMELESLAGRRRGHTLPFPAREDAPGYYVLDPLPLLAALGEGRRRGRDVESLAADFHESVVEGTAALVERLTESTGVRVVALGGGVFQNARLTVSLRDRLRDGGLPVLTARELPCNDGGLSYGQAVVAAAMLARERHGNERIATAAAPPEGEEPARATPEESAVPTTVPA
jgi:hydrogenase maturation protein HypF